MTHPSEDRSMKHQAVCFPPTGAWRIRTCIALVAMVFSVALFICPIAPITAMTRPSEISKPIECMIFAPARYVWRDPLGSH